MTDYGFKVSQPGYDVKTALDSQLVMTSKYNSHKMGSNLWGTSSFTLPVAPSPTIPEYYTFTVTHNFGYIPAFDAWFLDEFGIWKTCFMNMNGSVFGNEDGSQIGCFNDNHYADINTINIVFENTNTAQTFPVTVFYIIFVDQIA